MNDRIVMFFTKRRVGLRKPICLFFIDSFNCYDGEQVIAHYDKSGTLVRKFIYGPGIDEPVCMITVAGGTETKYYYHFDGLGSVKCSSFVNGQIAEQ